MVRIQDIFVAGTEVPAPEARDASATYRFRVPDVGEWWAVVHDGTIAFTDTEPGPADCMMVASEEEMLNIFNGDQNLLTAVMQGRVHVEGDILLLQRLHAYIRAHGATIVGAVR